MGFIEDQVRNGIQAAVSKMAVKWTIQDLNRLANQDAGLKELAGSAPGIYAALERVVRLYPSLQSLTYLDILGWISQANPRLGDQIVVDPLVLPWLKRMWERSKAELLGAIQS